MEMDIEAVIRQAIMAEIGERAQQHAEDLQRLTAEIEQVHMEIEATQQRLTDLRTRERELIRVYREFKADEQMIEQRVQAALAAMRGERITRTRPRTDGGSRPTAASAVQFDVTVNGKPRQYKDLTKLTYDMSKKLGRRIVVRDIYDTFEQQTGMRLFSAEHQEAGMVTIDLYGIELGLAVR
jgi:hypothetical protein